MRGWIDCSTGGGLTIVGFADTPCCRRISRSTSRAAYRRFFAFSSAVDVEKVSIHMTLLSFLSDQYAGTDIERRSALRRAGSIGHRVNCLLSGKMTLISRLFGCLFGLAVASCSSLPSAAPTTAQLVRTQDENWEVYVVKVTSLVTKALAQYKGSEFPTGFSFGEVYAQRGAEAGRYDQDHGSMKRPDPRCSKGPCLH